MSTISSDKELKGVYREVKRVAFKRGKVGIYDYEDIAQEAMIRYLNKSGGSFAPQRWISLAVKCVTWDLCRKIYSQRRMMEDFGADYSQAQFGTHSEFDSVVCESTVEESLDRKYLEIALIALLGEGTFEMLKLYADGFSYKEIAEKLDIKLGTVRSRVHYAKAKARAMLEI